MRDAELIFSSAQALGTSPATAVSSNIVDLGATVDHKNATLQSAIMSGKMCLNCTVTTDILAATDGSVVTFRLYDDTDTTPTTGGRVLLAFAITANTPVESGHAAGQKLFSLPLPAMPLSRYLGVSYQIETQTLSTGAVDCWIGPAI